MSGFQAWGPFLTTGFGRSFWNSQLLMGYVPKKPGWGSEEWE